MRVLITGATGFVGSYLIRHLLEVTPGSEIVGTAYGSSITRTDPRVRLVACDITANGGSEIAALIRAVKPDRLYHLAGVASAASQDHSGVFRANIDGTRHIMAAMAAEMSTAGRILFVSTGYVYGSTDAERPAREDDPVHPSGPYAESKRAAEQVVAHSSTVTARAFNHTGPEQTDTFVIPAFAKQIAAIEQGSQLPKIHVGNLDALRDFLDVRDVVRAYHLLIEQGIPGELYNVCSGVAISMRTALNQLLALSSAQIETVPDPARMRPSDLPISVGDPSKLMKLTGWQPEIPFGTTLRDTLDWWRQQSSMH